MRRLLRWLPALLLLAGCSVGDDDWVVVQYRADGTVLNCWMVHGAVYAEGDVGAFWLAPGGHVVHVSGPHNRVKVAHGAYASAAWELKLSLAQCTNGNPP